MKKLPELEVLMMLVLVFGNIPSDFKSPIYSKLRFFMKGVEFYWMLLCLCWEDYDFSLLMY